METGYVISITVPLIFSLRYTLKRVTVTHKGPAGLTTIWWRKN